MGAVAHGECQICGSKKLVEANVRVLEMEAAIDEVFVELASVQDDLPGPTWERVKQILDPHMMRECKEPSTCRS